jgi:hypothetical protein
MGAKDAKPPSFDVMGLLTQHHTRWSLSKYKENQIVYAQGDPADSVFYIHTGQVKVTVVYTRGKEVVVAIRGPGRILRRRGAKWVSAASGDNHYNVVVRDHTVGEANHRPPVS